MLIIAKYSREVSFSSLMNVYEESNQKAASADYPDEPAAFALQLAQDDFRQYLLACFFQTKGACYAIWEEKGQYVSALRLEPYKDGLLICGLETVPDQRGRGYASALLESVLKNFEGKIFSHVDKKNVPSLRVHSRCGFQRISEIAAYLDGSVDSRACTLLFEK